MVSGNRRRNKLWVWLLDLRVVSHIPTDYEYLGNFPKYVWHKLVM